MLSLDEYTPACFDLTLLGEQNITSVQFILGCLMNYVLCLHLKKSIFGIGMNLDGVTISKGHKICVCSLWEPNLRGHKLICVVSLGLSLTFHMSWISELSLGTGDFVHSHFLLTFRVWLVPN